MVKVTLVYPYFQPRNDNSIFRFPPLGLGYLASALKKNGFDVELVDCTFIGKQEAIEKTKRSNPDIIGIYSMFSMKKTSLEMGRLLKGSCKLLVAGGPLPTLDPADFLDVFDVAAVGEGEETIVDLAGYVEKGLPVSLVKGIAYKDAGTIRFGEPRGFVENLDALAFPARDLFDNEAYKNHYRKKFGYSTTPLISSRGCPFSCDFCSRPVYRTTFRSRSSENIVAEVEQIAGLGYDRIWFADDCFTLNREHLEHVCDLLVQKELDISWECLSRVDTLNVDIARKMKRAGCVRVFFGIESGNDGVLSLMKKQITTTQAQKAVFAAKEAGLKAGAFFIVGYPGESDRTVLDTVRFASALPLDYLSFTLPYPIPGTALHERVKDNGGVVVDDWEEPKNWGLIRHKLLYGSNFSERKLKFAIAKAQIQFRGRRFLGNSAYGAVCAPFEGLTDAAFRVMH
jgi:anaerobic magnesium-protoporphyrin IX monomethyl ester cyclase